MGEQPSFLEKHKYSFLFGIYILLTGGVILRITRQPYARSLKSDQIETIFKGATLAALIAGVGISGKLNQTRSSRA